MTGMAQPETDTRMKGKVLLHKFVKIGKRVEFGVMGYTAYWYFIPTIALCRCPSLTVDVYVRFLCFSINFLIKKGENKL